MGPDDSRASHAADHGHHYTAGTATVYYTNTIAGTAYTLERCANLTTGNWQPAGTQPAPGDSASQTDTAAGGDQRYYRVFHVP